MRAVFVLRVRHDLQVLAVRRDALDANGREKLDFIPPGLGDEAVGQLSSADALGETGVVVDALGDPGVSAERAFLDHEAVDALASGVDGGGEAGGSAADDDQVVEGALRLEL